VVAVFAHRGASARYPENTLVAFAEAARLGADGVELDVRRSADGAVVVHHDPALPGGRPISQLTVADLPETVPLLAAALDACGDLVVNIELKDLPLEQSYDPGHPLAGLVVAALADRTERPAVMISSFDLGAIDAVRALAPSVETAWLTPAAFDQPAALETAAAHGHRGLSPQHQAITETLVEAAHGLGLRITAWTVDEPERMRRLAAMGVDAIITNLPDVAVALLRE
jgi:glycerophosphoryl diester phosphodiesterase